MPSRAATSATRRLPKPRAATSAKPRLGDEHRAERDAPAAVARELVDARERAHAAAHVDREALDLADRPDRRRVGRAGVVVLLERGREVDHVHPGGTLLSEGAGDGHRVVRVDLHARAVAALQAHDLAGDEVDSREYDHARTSPGAAEPDAPHTATGAASAAASILACAAASASGSTSSAARPRAHRAHEVPQDVEAAPGALLGVELAAEHVAARHDAREAPRVVRPRRHDGRVHVVGERVGVGEVHVRPLGEPLDEGARRA